MKVHLLPKQSMDQCMLKPIVNSPLCASWAFVHSSDLTLNTCDNCA